MGTNNFRNHKNGIFALEQTSFEQMKEWMETDEFFQEIREDGLTDEDVYDQMQFEDERNAEEFLSDWLPYQLEEKGFTTHLTGERWNEVLHVYRGEKKLAEMHLESGYYDGVQVIVNTDPSEILPFYEDTLYNDRIEDYQDEPVKHKLYEMYSEHNVRMFKVLESCTVALSLDGVFSNGEALYSKKN